MDSRLLSQNKITLCLNKKDKIKYTLPTLVPHLVVHEARNRNFLNVISSVVTTSNTFYYALANLSCYALVISYVVVMGTYAQEKYDFIFSCDT